ncbi:MAG: c-type cytochrome [Methylophilaceae bacterium]
MGLLLRLMMLMLVASSATWAAGDAAKGAEIAKAVCVACHAADGNSPTPAFPKLAGQFPEYLVKQLKNFKSGERANAVMMPISSALSDEDMQNVAAHFAAQKSKEAGAVSNGKGSVGEKIYRAGIADSKVPACASCHGPAGNGLPVRFPRLGGQYADYTTAQMKAFRSGERANAPMMKTIAARMSDADIAAVSDYIQGVR